MANSTVGYIALLRQLASFARLGRRSLDVVPLRRVECSTSSAVSSVGCACSCKGLTQKFRKIAILEIPKNQWNYTMT